MMDNIIAERAERKPIELFGFQVKFDTRFIRTDFILFRHVFVRCIGAIFDAISDKLMSNAFGSIAQAMKFVLGIDRTEING